MKILLDGRLYGLENGGPGRYVINLISELQKIDKKNKYIVLLRKKYFNQLNFPKHWEKVLADFRHYSFVEQIKVPLIIGRYRPDIVHFPHFNVPIFFKCKFVVTIHDIIMHKFRGVETSTLPTLLYFVKRLGYKRVFEKAIYGSSKIIAPSEFTKEEIIKNYKINPQKIVVTYEGVN